MFKPRYLTYLMVIAMLPLSETQAIAIPLYSEPQIAAPVYTPLTANQLYQLVSPIALFPDKLLAQVLAGAGYPDQISAADNWLAQNRGLQPAAVLAAANQQPWDSSIRSLTLFPDVLDQMAKNLNWTTQLGYAYLNDPTDVMNAIQVMRQRADRTGTLKDTPQQRVVISPVPPDYVEPTLALQTIVTAPDEIIVIEPSQPDILYVPYYDPWEAYGAPVRTYPGYHQHAPSGYNGGDMLAAGIVSFGAGMALEALINPHHQGWNDWNVHWNRHYDGRHQPVVYNNQPYVSHSPRVIEHITNINEHITTINEYDSHASTINRYNSPVASSPHAPPHAASRCRFSTQHPFFTDSALYLLSTGANEPAKFSRYSTGRYAAPANTGWWARSINVATRNPCHRANVSPYGSCYAANRRTHRACANNHAPEYGAAKTQSSLVPSGTRPYASPSCQRGQTPTATFHSKNRGTPGRMIEVMPNAARQPTHAIRRLPTICLDDAQILSNLRKFATNITPCTTNPPFMRESRYLVLFFHHYDA